MLPGLPGTTLAAVDLPLPQPDPGELRLTVEACGVGRTDLHLVDGELPEPVLPVSPRHEIVGRVDALGAGVMGFHIGQRVGVPSLEHTCGTCACCDGGRETLCDAAPSRARRC